MKVKLLCCVWLFVTPWTVAYQAPPWDEEGKIFQARVLEWIAISFSRGYSRPRDQTQVSCIVDRRFTAWATREANKVIYVWYHTGKCTRDGLIKLGLCVLQYLSRAILSHEDRNSTWTPALALLNVRTPIVLLKMAFWFDAVLSSSLLE